MPDQSRSPDAATHLDPYDKSRDDRLDFPEVGEKDDEWRESPEYWNGLCSGDEVPPE